jgi:chemotaxis protein methyltransferase CheR
MVPDELLRELSQMVNQRIGAYLPEQRRADLERGVRALARTLGFETPELCARELIKDSATRYLDALIDHFTIGETFFFRDRLTLKALEEHVLSEFTPPYSKKSSLKIWSAGCCTGEEPYTLCMMLDMLGFGSSGTNVFILATDLNPKFLEKARQGLYGRWSFRDTPEEVMRAYFTGETDGRQKIARRIQEKITFRQLNLIKDRFPSPNNDTHNMDVVFCRNVLMYFSETQRIEVVGRLCDCLNDGGWFITSPGETAFIQDARLETVCFEGAILHRKGAHNEDSLWRRGVAPAKQTGPSKTQPVPGNPHVPGFPLPQPSSPFPYPPLDRARGRGNFPETGAPSAPVVSKPVDEPRAVPAKTKGQDCGEGARNLLEEARKFYANGAYKEAVGALEQRFRDGAWNHGDISGDEEALALLTRAHANLGRLDEAVEWCGRAVGQDKFHAGKRYLLATLYEELGEFEKSARSLGQALYLEPGFVLAHFSLGTLLQRQGRLKESKKHLKNALTLLSALESNEILPYSEGLTAGRLLGVVRAMVKKEAAA